MMQAIWCAWFLGRHFSPASLMARYKIIDTNPRFLPVDLARQLLPGTFEHALNHLLDHAIDLSSFDARFCNDETGATAYPPAMLLKVVLFAYSQGIVSSRGIERACREHVTFIVLCGDTSPHLQNPSSNTGRASTAATARSSCSSAIPGCASSRPGRGARPRNWTESPRVFRRLGQVSA